MFLLGYELTESGESEREGEGERESVYMCVLYVYLRVYVHTHVIFFPIFFGCTMRLCEFSFLSRD